MLKKFFLNALSAFVGAWAAFVLIGVAIFVMIIGIVTSLATSSTEKLEKGSILKIVLSGNISEKEENPRLDYSTLISGKLDKSQSLKNIKAAIETAATNSNIDAIYIECNGASAGPATLNAIHESLTEFKKSGKRIVAYGNSFTMNDYFVATAADAIYLNPAGKLDLQGINGTTLFYKDFLDKVGIDVEMVKVGTYKSAVEPYISNSMSEPARAQLDTLYSQMWGYILDVIGERTKLKSSEINELVNGCLFLESADYAKKKKLIDECLYERQVYDKLADYVGKEKKNLNFVSPDFIASGNIENPEAKHQIAVVYAVGDIGEYEGAGINCAQLVPIIVGLAENDNVEGMVLRVNSPGGSVFGSEQIGEALDYFQSKGKPLAVSMGSYAASGGYWISADADRIFADPLTITGSIGIFGLIPNISRLADKIGIHPQSVGTNTDVMFPSIFYPMSESQQAAMQKYIEQGYEDFVTRVAKGRKKSVSYIKSIAEGRVWSAIQAQKIGLVDELGNMENAISWVADKVQLDDYNTVSYPMYDAGLFGMLPVTLQNSKEIQAVVEHLERQSVESQLIDFTRWFLLQAREQARCPYFDISL